MEISKSQSKHPIFKGEVWITKKDHGIELKEKKSQGADKRYSVTYVQIDRLELLKGFKVMAVGKKKSRLNTFILNCKAWLIWRWIK